MTSDLPRPEYPRPDRDRSHSWLPLNGTWELEYPGGESDTTRVIVPFAWETPASGVRRTWMETATYRRAVRVPESWAGRRIVLCFGAVHHHARVLVDGEPVAEHTGGHTAFEVDVTGHVSAGAGFELAVEVHAPIDKRSIPHGKQRSIPRDDYDGVSFTPTSGIWQSVWLEGRGHTYVAPMAIRGDSLTGFDLEGTLLGADPAGARVAVAVRSGSEQAVTLELVPDTAGRVRGRVELAQPLLWSPEDPHLYTLTFTTTSRGGESDVVTMTAGLRRIEAVGERLYLNGDRLYVRGVLDQGYWPETGLTAPDEDAILRDLELARQLGYNLVRKHIKLEEPRWLHHADRLGMLVWAEPPGPSRFSPEAAAAFEAQLSAMVDRDGNHPSIVIWGLYNEEWGLDWNIPGSPERAAAAAHAYDAMRALDPTRLVVDNSGWAHVRTDLVDWHYYDEDPQAWATNLAALAAGDREDFPVKLGSDYVVAKALYADTEHPRAGVPILNSEYGAGFTSLERAWHLRWQTQEMRRHDRFAGYVYTELSDVEHELAGIVDADRRPKDLGGLDPAHINAVTVLVPDVVPAVAGADLTTPAEPFHLTVRVSHHGTNPIEGRVRAAWLAAGQPIPQNPAAHRFESSAVKAEPFELSDPAELRIDGLPGASHARLHVWLVDADEAVQAHTYIDVAPVEAPNRP